MPRGIPIVDLDLLEVLTREYSVPMQRYGDPAGRATIGQILALVAAAQGVQPGSDFDDLGTPGLYILTSDANAPFDGGRWLVWVDADPLDPGAVLQEAVPLTGGTGPTPFARRSEGGVFGNWISSGAPDANGVPYDDSNAYAGAENVQEALEESANYTGYVENETTPQGYVRGMTGANDPIDPANDVTFAPGQARGNSVTVTTSAPTTKRLDAAWAPGSNQGGLDTGTKQAGQTYHWHAIRRDIDGVGDFIASLSPTAPMMPEGWTRVQRVRPDMTDGSGNIRPTIQDGNEFRLRIAAGLTAYNASGSRPTALLTCPLPVGVRVMGLFTATLACGSTPNPVSGGQMTLGDGNDSTVLSEFRQWVVTGGNGGVTYFARDAMCRTNASAQIYLGIQNGDGSYGSSVVVRGWVDESIPRIGA